MENKLYIYIYIMEKNIFFLSTRKKLKNIDILVKSEGQNDVFTTSEKWKYRMNTEKKILSVSVSLRYRPNFGIGIGISKNFGIGIGFFSGIGISVLPIYRYRQEYPIWYPISDISDIGTGYFQISDIGYRIVKIEPIFSTIRYYNLTTNHQKSSKSCQKSTKKWQKFMQKNSIFLKNIFLDVNGRSSN